MLLEVKGLLDKELFSVFGLMANIQLALRPRAVLRCLGGVLCADYERIHSLLLLRLLHCASLVQIIEHLLAPLLLALLGGFGATGNRLWL